MSAVHHAPAVAALLACLAFAGCGAGGDPAPAGTEPDKENRHMLLMKVTSSAFDSGTRIPKKYTGEGEDVSPPIAWSGAPSGTREFALICDDPDAPRPDPWVHWVVYSIPPGRNSFPEGSTPESVEGRNTGGQPGYAGPMPPKNHGVHHYHFRIYALDTQVKLAPGATKQELLAAMKNHVIAEGEVVGTYERR